MCLLAVRVYKNNPLAFYRKVLTFGSSISKMAKWIKRNKSLKSLNVFGFSIIFWIVFQFYRFLSWKVDLHTSFAAIQVLSVRMMKSRVFRGTTITGLKLVKDYSGKCVKNGRSRSYGFSGSRVFVRGGCDADFEIQFTGIPTVFFFNSTILMQLSVLGLH